MANIRVTHQDGGAAKNTKVKVSVSGGGMVEGITNNDGMVNISTSGTRGKIYVNGREVYEGSLDGAHVTYR